MGGNHLNKKYKKKWKRISKKLLLSSLIGLLLLQTILPINANIMRVKAEENMVENSSYIDKIQFGNEASEQAHRFHGEFTRVVTGLFGEPARISTPKKPAEREDGDLTFTMKVDPHLQNYLTVKFSGEESSENSVVYVNGEQVGYMSNGAYEAINKGWQLSNRFFYNTVMLPLESTRNQEEIEIMIRNAWGNVTSTSRGYYNAYTHTQAYIDVADETHGYKFTEDQSPENILPAEDLSEEEKQEIVDSYNEDLIDRFNHLTNKSDENENSKLSIVRYQDELMFYAYGLTYDQFPLQTAEEKAEGLERIFKSIDNHVKDYYGNTRMVLRGGHQGDWGGYYGALGEALYIVENLIMDEDIYGEDKFAAFLDQPFDTGTEEGEFSLASEGWNGEELTRRAAWERTLKANFDFARSRLSYISNQVYYTYVGAWEASEGLRLIDSDFYEGKDRSNRILMESLGIVPFLGEEVLVGPEGEELDVYHSLFHHDGQAHFTDDYIHIISKGLAQSKLDDNGEVVRRKPYGEHFTSFTEAGLARENGYVANYGEALNYLINYYHKTLGHDGDEEMNDELLKAALRSIHARGQTRYSSLENGNRVMRAEQVTDERNQTMTGFPSYGARIGTGMSLQHASLEKQMADNPERYAGEEWEPYWQYAREAVGFVQQQDFDHQLIQNNDFGHHGTMSGTDFRLDETYQYITSERANYDRFDGEQMAGVVLPQTDFDYYQPEELAALGVDPADYQQHGWADIDNMYVSIKDDDFRMFGTLFFRNRGIEASGKLRVMTDEYDHVVQIATNNQFQYEDYFIRTDNIDWDFQNNREHVKGLAKQALVGEVLPISYQPGVGRVNRDNFEADTPYSGYPELQTSRYGKYFIIFNTTREEYSNERSFEVEIPNDYQASRVLDLISGRNIAITDGKVTIPAKTAMVLKLDSTIEAKKKPNHVDFVNALAGNDYVGISWKSASGAETYTIKRSESENGSYEVIASNVEGNYYQDTTAENGKTYYYKVVGVNEQDEGWESWRQRVELSDPISEVKNNNWRDDRIGTSTGSAEITNDSISIADVDGTGLGSGNDYIIYQRDIHDSLHYVNSVTSGNHTISTRIDQAEGAISGLMLRDRNTPDLSRYVFFGADQDGQLVLQTRTRNSIVEWSDEVVSPYQADIGDYLISDYPYLQLTRDHDTQMVQAFVSKDGQEWQFVAETLVLLPFAYYTGVATSESAQFSQLSLEETEQDQIIPYLTQEKDQVNLHWNKPKQVALFNVYKTYDEEGSKEELVFKDGSLELVEDSAWTEALIGTKATLLEERKLRVGSVHFKILPIYSDGTVGEASDVVSAYADSIEDLLASLRSIKKDLYTRVSYYLFQQELDRISDVYEAGNFDELQLVNELYSASNLLVPFQEVLLEKIDIEPDMVVASTEAWPAGSGVTAEENGWRAFDGDTGTFSDTLASESWVDVDLGEGNEKTVSAIRFYPRSGNELNRINGLIIQGSNDQKDWTDLHKISGVTETTWHDQNVNNSTSYRFLRLYDDHDGRVNVAEIEFYEMVKDKTLLEYLIAEAEEMEERIYTEDSMQTVKDRLPSAIEIMELETATQAQIDEVADDLLAALNELEFIDDVPVLAPIGNKSVIAETELSFDLYLVNGDKETVEYTVENLPEGAEFDEEIGSFSWTPNKEQGGQYQVTFSVSDGEKETSRTITIVVRGEPSLTIDTNTNLWAGEEFELDIDAVDPNDEQLTYRVVNLPNGATLSQDNKQMIWTPNNTDVGNHEVSFYVSNGHFTVSETLTFTVNIPAEKYTQGSYYLFNNKFEAIEAEMESTGGSREDYQADINEAVDLLVPIETLYQKIKISEDMVIASAESYGNDTREANGWFAFDDNLDTFTDTPNPGWVRVDLGTGNEKEIDKVRFHPRRGHAHRMNGGRIEASNDAEEWNELVGISDIDRDAWFERDISDIKAYQYFRFYSPNGHSNIAELEFYEMLADKTLLEVLLDEASVINQEIYTDESIEILANAVTEATNVFEDEDSTQEEIDTEVEKLGTALENLKRIELDVQALEELLEEVITLLEEAEAGDNPGQYPQEAMETLELALQEAENILNNDQATQADIDLAVSELADAKLDFISSVHQVDRSELIAMIDQVKSLLNQAEPGEEPGQYPPEAIATFRTAIDDAESVLANEQATQTEINETIANLEEARLAFETEVIPETEVDTEELIALIEEVREMIEEAQIGVETGQYPQEALSKLETELKVAQAILANEDSTQEEVNQAISDLEAAIELFEASVNPEQPEPEFDELKDEIAKAENELDQAEVGTESGQYPQDAINALQSAIVLAKEMLNDDTMTQQQVDEMVEYLREAIDTFRESVIQSDDDTDPSSDPTPNPDLKPSPDPKDPEQPVDHDQEEGNLPSTATSIYNLALIGFTLVLVGTFIIFTKRLTKRKQ